MPMLLSIARSRKSEKRENELRFWHSRKRSGKPKRLRRRKLRS